VLFGQALIAGVDQDLHRRIGVDLGVDALDAGGGGVMGSVAVG
jgi:hypothetical protein